MTETQNQTSSHGIALALLLIAVFAGMFPTLGWLEFSSGSENLNAGTVLEMHRGGPWLIPTLNDRPRLAKPPWTAWVSASLVNQSDVNALSNSDQTARDRAFQRFAIKLRWPALLQGCGIMLATYMLGSALIGSRFGWVAAGIAGGSLLFLRFTRSATTDVQLALWVSLANALFALLVINRRSIPTLIGIGLCLGLGMMSKGPVALVQTVLPWTVFIALHRETRNQLRQRPGRWWLGAAMILLFMLLICLPWPAYVISHFPNAVQLWQSEITREGATPMPRDPWYAYISLIFMMLPWAPFFIAGLIMAIRKRGDNRAELLALCLLIVPILIMTIAKDKNERYLLPMLPAAAMISALAVIEQFKLQRNSADRALGAMHWIIVALMVVGFPIASATRLAVRDDGTPWMNWSLALPLAGLSAFAWLVGWMISRKRVYLMLPSTVVLMLLANAIFIYGYAFSRDGRSEMKAIADIALARDPSARMWYYDPRPAFKQQPQDLAIYLNRVVPDVRDLSSIPRAAGNDTLIILQRENEPDPNIEGWRPIGKAPWGQRFWWAFARGDSSVKPQ